MRRRTFVTVLVLLAIGFLLAACSSPEKPVKTQEAPAATASSEPPAEEPAATVEVVWYWCDPTPDAPVFRFVAMIHNPGSKPIADLETEWVAYDAQESIVGSFKGKRPVIPAGATIPYVGGAGWVNLTGVPARAQVTITNPGRFVDEVPEAFAVSDVAVTADGTNEYTVTAKVTTGSTEIASSGLAACVVLKDDAGAIVGGDFWISEGLPERLPAGSTFNIRVEFVPTTAAATTADITVVQEEQ